MIEFIEVGIKAGLTVKVHFIEPNLGTTYIKNDKSTMFIVAQKNPELIDFACILAPNDIRDLLADGMYKKMIYHNSCSYIDDKQLAHRAFLMQTSDLTICVFNKRSYPAKILYPLISNHLETCHEGNLMWLAKLFKNRYFVETHIQLGHETDAESRDKNYFVYEVDQMIYKLQHIKETIKLCKIKNIGIEE